MSLFGIFDIAGSAMSAQTVRLNTTASNLANADNVSGSEADAYRARHPVFSTFRDALDNSTAGVKVDGIVESQAQVQREYQPNNPLADPEGYVYRSNVDVVGEMADMISASRSYQANVEVFNSAKELAVATLNMGR